MLLRSLPLRTNLFRFDGCFLSEPDAPNHAQPDSRPDNIQMPGASSLQQSGRESLNLGSGSLSGFLPVVDLPQRGGRTLRLGYSISNDTWTLKETSVHLQTSTELQAEAIRKLGG